MDSLGRLGHAVIALALLTCLLAALWWTRSASPLAYLPGGGPGEWIVYPLAPRIAARAAPELETRFRRPLDLSRAPESARVALRALGEASLRVNGAEVFQASGKTLKRADVASSLRAGRNEIAVSVRHAGGPPALALELSVDGETVLRSDASWHASLAGAAWRPVRLCDEPAGVATHPAPPAAPEWLLAFAALSGALLFAACGAGAASTRLRRLGPLSAFALLVGAPWLVLLVHNFDQYPARVGFDVHHHVRYVEYILTRHALPLPSDGAQGYQPPLFYALCAGLLALLGLDPSQDSAVRVLRVFTWSLGLVHVGALFGVVRRLLPGRTCAQLMALVFAGFLPMHLYLFDFFTNEALVAALGSVSVYGLVRILQDRDPGPGAFAALGATLGAALLAKQSALVLAPLVLAALVAGHPRLWPRAVLALAVMLLVGGWHYARVAWAFGNPLVGNWDPAVGFRWWQDPGYRTASQYIGFGRALVDPWFAGFHGVPDGLYSTLWGDGLAGGATSRRLGPSWNAGLMRQNYWLAAVPLAAGALGLVRGTARALRRPSALSLFLGLLLLGMGLAIFYMTLRVPSYAQAKAFYAHLALAPACVAFALGADWLWCRGRRSGLVFAWLLGIWALNAYASFFMLEGTRDGLLQRGDKALAFRDVETARGAFERMLRSDPEDVEAHIGLCRVHLDRGAGEAARSHCEAALASAPDHPEALLQSSRIRLARGEGEAAIALLRRALAAAPDDGRIPPVLASLLSRRGERAEAARMAREWLRFDPTHPRARALADGGDGS